MKKDKRLILSIAKKHYLNKKWYTAWDVETNWQKCIFDAIRELDYKASFTFPDAARFLIEAANLELTEENTIFFNKYPRLFCLKVIDKYYQKQNFVSALEIE